MDADGRVRRAGPAGHERDAGAAGQLAVGFRHVGGAALVAADDKPQRFARFVERVEDREIALARNAEGEVDALREEIGDQNLATGARRAHWRDSSRPRPPRAHSPLPRSRAGCTYNHATRSAPLAVPTFSPMNLPPALHDALLFTVAGAFFALVMMRWKRDQRQAMLQMLILLVLGVVGSAGAESVRREHRSRRWQARPCAKLCLLLAAFGFIRIFLVFVFQGMFARMALPRILGDVLFAFSLLTYAVYRMYAVGFDFASIAITSTAIAGGVALSLKEPLANLWGGVSIQLDNTCRIGDWIRIEGGAWGRWSASAGGTRRSRPTQERR